jgi:hypothetical protein
VDAIAWLVAGAVLALGAAGLWAGPHLRRENLRRQLEGGGGALSGIGAGFDGVWRPSAEEARALWETQVELPAPAPTPDDEGRLRDGQIVIELRD